MTHKWTKARAQGVTSGSGRPHGVDVCQECERCGVSRGSGPQSTHTGRRVIRRWMRDAHGNTVDRLPTCRPVWRREAYTPEGQE